MNGVLNESPRQEQLEQFLDKLVDVEYVMLSDDSLSTFTQELCEIYADDEFRHSYSKISGNLEKFSPDQRDSLSAHISAIHTHASAFVKNQYSDNADQQKNIINKISKLCDHIDLECLRIARIEKVEYIGKTASNELSAADGKLRETEARAAELESKVSGFQEQSIAILGIFAGLVVTFSGVIQFTSSSLSNLNDISTLKITYFVCLSLFFLFNIIFLLMYCISKISGSSIASNCKQRHCEKCKSCRTVFGRLRKKYPYVFWFNFVGAIFCMVLCHLANASVLPQ